MHSVLEKDLRDLEIEDEAYEDASGNCRFVPELLVVLFSEGWRS